MSRFNTYFNNNFSGCRLLAYARDPHRGRDVSIYMMPGFVEEVGVTDGIDKWICPVIANPFSVNIIDIMRRVIAGESIPTPVKPGVGKTSRRAVLAEEPATTPKPSRRALLAPINEVPTPSRSRRAVII